VFQSVICFFTVSSIFPVCFFSSYVHIVNIFRTCNLIFSQWWKI
jgi:hypothetical protein